MAAKAQRSPEPTSDTGNKPAPVISERMPSCTRCGKRDAVEVEEGIPARMCQECRDYMRDYYAKYRSEGEIRARAKGWADGAESMRKLLMQRFSQCGSGVFMGHEAAKIIQQEKAPLVSDPV